MELNISSFMNSRSKERVLWMVGSNYKVGKKLGSGNFGEIRYGKNIYTNEEVAVKIEPVVTKTPQLENEYNLYKILGEGDGIPEIYYYGLIGSMYNAMVMELLGPSLDYLFNLCENKFTLKTTILIAIQLLYRFEFIHTKRIVFRDVKPENFVIGRIKSDKEKIIHVLDFGLSKEYMDKNNIHIKYKEKHNLVGTARYMSINTHLGTEQSRRDDLEAIGHMLIYFLKGSLPWQGLKTEDKYKKYKLIEEIKKNTTIETLCEGLPDEFAIFLRYARQMDFYQKPDYDYMRKLFQDLYNSNKYNNDLFDWNEKANIYNKLKLRFVD